MLIKTALRNLKKNPVMNAMCFVQLAAVFLITAVMVSTMSVRYRTYNPVKDILESSGLYCMFNGNDGAVKPGGELHLDGIFSVKELNRYMNADKIFSIQTETAVPNGINGKSFATDTFTPAHSIFYDDELLKRYAPKLKRGRWISENADEIEIVIPEGMYGADIGDTIDFIIVQVHNPKQVTMRVVGILEDGAEILGKERPRNESGDTYRLMYAPYYLEIEEERNPVILASASVITSLVPDIELNFDTAFCIYDNPDDVSKALRSAAQIGSAVTIWLDEMNANSLQYLREQLLQLLPIAVVLMILVIVNAMSVSAIAARRRLTDYAKYYVLGLRWRQCAAVNFLQAFLTGAAALVVSSAAIFVIGFTPLAETVTVIWSASLIFSLLGVFALYLIFSMIMPLMMLRSTTPKALLQAE